MLECVINISEGRDGSVLRALSASATRSLIDLHSDAHHHRSVFTLAGDRVVDDAVALTRAAITHLSIDQHSGVHPRIGVVDVVPFVPMGDAGLTDPPRLEEALAARDKFVAQVIVDPGLPCFLYGPERTLPEIRRTAFHPLQPDFGPRHPLPGAGACCVGARGVLIAYNVNVTGLSLRETKTIADRVRAPELRTLGLSLDGNMQISCNLIAPMRVGIEDAYDRIAIEVERSGGYIDNAELVGLVPQAVYDSTDPERRERLGLAPTSTIESRLTSR